MSKTRHNKKKKQNNNKEKNVVTRVLPKTHIEFDKIGRLIIPSEVDVTLPFIRLFVVTGGAPQITKRFNPNSVYRPDPATFSFDAMGVAEWQSFYSLYRVIRYTHQSIADNNEDFSVVAGVTNSNSDPSVSQGATELMNDYSQSAVLSPKGSGRSQHVFRQTFNVATVVGSDDIEYDDDYRGLLTAGAETSPPDLLWLGCTARSIGGGNLNVGVSWEVRIWMTVRLYDRQQFSQGTATVTQGNIQLPIGTTVPIRIPVVSEQRQQERVKDQLRTYPRVEVKDKYIYM